MTTKIGLRLGRIVFAFSDEEEEILLQLRPSTVEA